MDHKDQHHQHHQKEREHEKKEHKAHERDQEKNALPIHPAWLMGVAVVLMLAAMGVWIFLF